MSDRLTTKQKIDEALGLSGGKSLDEMLNDLNIESEGIHQTFDEIDQTIKKDFDRIDEKALELQRGETSGILAINDMNASLKEVELMINQAKEVFQHMVNNITSSDLLDSELIHAAAAFMESIHLNIAEFLSIYKQKQKFVEKIKLMIFNQEQKKELMALKHKYDMEKLAVSKPSDDGNTIDTTGSVMFNTDDIVKKMSEIQFEDEADEDDDQPGKKKKKSPSDDD